MRRGRSIFLKNKDRRMAELKYKISHMGVFYAVLSDKERRYAIERGATVENYLYIISVKFPQNFRVTESTPNIVKNLFWRTKKERKHVFYMKLSSGQKSACTNTRYRDFITVKPYKYKITSSAI